MPPMSHHRCLIPILSAALVIQGLVAVVPHTHGSDTAGMGPAAGSSEAVVSSGAEDGSHRCLACTVHAPLVEPGPEFVLVTSEVPTPTGATERHSNLAPPPSCICQSSRTSPGCLIRLVSD